MEDNTYEGDMEVRKLRLALLLMVGQLKRLKWYQLITGSKIILKMILMRAILWYKKTPPKRG